jgi:CheY-like chemotaxis protein
MTILVIDDEMELLDLVLEMLKYEGYEVLRAETGTEGLKLLRDRLPDLVLCDIRLPDIDGFDVLEAAKRDPATQAIPFVFISGLTDMDVIRKSEQLGAVNYLIKPVAIQDLLPVIKIVTD